ncbi:MAG: hypothetical protein E7047_08545 [Lentisphaerae bacterium]|nr:hypothetical protein [Lentisphaerota bacterium]
MIKSIEKSIPQQIQMPQPETVDAASTGVLMSTFWNQYGTISIGSNKTVAYNEYCPILPNGDHAVTGCTNTAAGQMIYYFIEKKGLKLTLTLDSSDEYLSTKHNITIKADGSTAGTISFAAVNSMLASYDLNSASDAAALIYACGVVQEADYGSSTSTAWNEELFLRAGLSGCNLSRLYWENFYYWGYAPEDDKNTDPAQYKITEGAWEVLIENLQAGLVVGTSVPGHAIVIDGYDSSDNTFHLNYGWGKSVDTRWYTKSEMIEQNLREFVFDLGWVNNSVITVNDADLYGTGTMLRAFEKANADSKADSMVFADSVAGEQVELLDKISVKNTLTANNMNMTVLVNDTQYSSNGFGIQIQGGVATLGGSLALIVNQSRINYAVHAKAGTQLRLTLDGGIIWSGSYAVNGNYANGTKNVLAAMQQTQLAGIPLDSLVINNAKDHYILYSNKSSKSTFLEIKNNSIAVGNVYTGDAADDIVISDNSKLFGTLYLCAGNDWVSVLKGSVLNGDIDFGSGSNQITIDSSSCYNGVFYNNTAVKLKLQDGFRSSTMLSVSKSFYNFYSYASSITVDIAQAVNGTYTLLSGYADSVCENYMKKLNFNLTGFGNNTTLSINGTATSTYATLTYSNYKLTLTISGKTAGTAPSAAPGGFKAEINGHDATLSWNAQSQSSNYLYRVGKSSALTGNGVLVSSNSAQLHRLDKNTTYYYQVRSVGSNGALSAWSSVQSFVAGGSVDLQVSKFASASVIAPNTALTLSYTVKNAGTITAAASKLYIYVDGVKVGETSVGAIAAGASYSGSYTIAAGKISDGTHKVRLLADGAVTIKETNENNNGYTRTIEAVAPADLVVSSFSCAASSPVNQDLQLKFTVKNQGSGTAAASKVYVYSDGVKIGEAAISSMAAGGSITASYTIKANTLTQGSRRIRLVADGANTVVESDNNNNGYSRAVTVTAASTAKVDLLVSTFAGASEITDSDAFKINFTVKNTGSDIASYNKLYIYDDGVKIGEVFVGTIYGNSTYSGSYTIAAGTLAAGVNRIRLVADGENIIAETNESNNGYTRSITVKPPADLTVASFSAPAAAAQNQSVKLNFTIKNSGKGAAESCKLYIYNDGVKIGETTISALAAGASYSGSYTISAGKLTSGTHRLRLVADGANTVVESDNNNNGYSRAVTVTAASTAKVDLLVSTFAGASEITDSDAFKINFTVKNTGSDIASYNKLYIYDDGVKIGEVFVGTIYGNSTYSGSYTIAAGTLAAGVNRIRLVADGENIIAETNESNNGYTRSITVKPPADLTVASFSAPAAAAQNQSVKLNFTIKNSGKGAAESCKLYIYSDGVKIGETTISALAAGASYSGSYTISAGKLTSGTHKLRLLADGANTVSEKDNNNNGYSRNINISSAASSMPEAWSAADEPLLLDAPSVMPDTSLAVDAPSGAADILNTLTGELNYFANSNCAALSSSAFDDALNASQDEWKKPDSLLA